MSHSSDWDASTDIMIMITGRYRELIFRNFRVSVVDFSKLNIGPSR
jgi:hypothetical protein